MNTSHTSLRPIGESLKVAWTLYRKHMNALALVSIIPLIFGAVGMTLHPELAANRQVFLGMIGIIAVFNILNLVFTILMPVALISTIEDSEHGHHTDMNKAYNKAFSLGLPYLFVLLLSGVIVFGGSIFFLIPGIIVNTYLMFVAFIFLCEGKRGIDALIQSAWYVRGFWIDIFARKITSAVVALVAIILFSTIISGLGAMTGFESTVLDFLVSLFTFILVVPFTICFTYVIYKDAKTAKSHTAPTAAFHSKAEKIFIILMIIAALFVFALFLLISFAPQEFLILTHSGHMTVHHNTHGFMGN